MSKKKPAASKAFKTTIVRDGSTCFIPIPFDPVPVFGKIRVPVKVMLNGYTYRSTIASMGNGPCIPLRKSNREAAQTRLHVHFMAAVAAETLAGRRIVRERHRRELDHGVVTVRR